MKQGKVFTLILAFIISVIMLSMIVSLAGQNSEERWISPPTWGNLF